MTDNFDYFEKDKQQLACKYDGLIEEVKDMGLEAIQENLCLWRKKIEDNRFLVLVIGDFSRGKSTLINALLGKEVLPSKETPTTGVINVIKYGPVPKAFVYYKGDYSQPKEILFSEFEQAVMIDDSGEAEAGSMLNFMKNPIDQIDLVYPFDFCKNGVEIVDSPGLNDRQSNSKMTYGFLPKCDAAIVVLTAENLLAANEVENIEYLVKSGIKNLFFVVNFWDQVDKSKKNEENEATRSRLRAENILGSIIAKKDLRIFYLSASQALEGKIANDQEILNSSKFIDFEKSLSKFLVEERGHAFIKQATSNFESQKNLVQSEIETRELLAQKTIVELQSFQDSIQPQLNDVILKKDKILQKVRTFVERVTRNRTEKFEIMLDRLANSGLKNEAINWKSEQTLFLLPYQTRKCTEDFVVLCDRHIQQTISDWVLKECGAELVNEIKGLDREIIEDVKSIDAATKRLQSAVNPDLGKVSCEKKEPVTTAEWILCGAGLLILSPAAGFGVGITGYKGAVINIGSAFAAGFLLSVMGLFSLGTVWIAGAVIGLIQIFFNNKDKQSEIKGHVVDRFAEMLGKKSREMSRQLESSLRDFFDEIYHSLENGLDQEINGIASQLNKVIIKKTAAKDSVDKTLAKFSIKKEIVHRTIAEKPYPTA